MSDLDRLTQEATQKAVMAVGRDAAKRAVDQLLTGDEKPEAKVESPGAAKARRYKMIALAVLGLFLVVGVVGLVLHYWIYFLLAGVLGVAGLIAWSRLRSKKDEAQLSKASAEAEALPAEKTRVAPEVEAEALALLAKKKRAEAQAEARAVAEAEAVREHEVDEELAAMKARLKR